MSPDWNEWHHVYDSPNAKFAQRLATTHALLAEILNDRPPGAITVIDVCAGQGRVTLPLVLTHPRGADIHAILIDADAQCCDEARAFAAEHALAHVDVIHGDAGVSDTYVGCARGDIVIFSGVIRYLSRRDLKRTMRALPQLCTPAATVVWSQCGDRYISIAGVRRTLASAGFREVALRDHSGTAMRRASGFVGAACMTTNASPLVPGVRWFQFRAPPSGVLGHAQRIVRGTKQRIRRVI